MSSYAPVPPPPGPPPPQVAGPPAASATPQARPQVSSPPRRMVVQPPAISTSLHHSNAGTPYLQTPASAVSPPSALPFSPYAASSNPPSQPSTAPTSASRVSSPMAFRGPSSAVSSYNPQEWGRHGSHVGGQFMPHATSSPGGLLRGSTREATGMEGNCFLLFLSYLILSIHLQSFRSCANRRRCPLHITMIEFLPSRKVTNLSLQRTCPLRRLHTRRIPGNKACPLPWEAHRLFRVVRLLRRKAPLPHVSACSAKALLATHRHLQDSRLSLHRHLRMHAIGPAPATGINAPFSAFRL